LEKKTTQTIVIGASTHTVVVVVVVVVVGTGNVVHRAQTMLYAAMLAERHTATRLAERAHAAASTHATQQSQQQQQQQQQRQQQRHASSSTVKREPSTPKRHATGTASPSNDNDESNQLWLDASAVPDGGVALLHYLGIESHTEV
jgi:transcription initiation factor TFIID subunit TAF12